MSKSKHKKDVGKFRSHFELEVAGKLGEENYEISELNYEIPATQHIYKVDFTLTAKDGHKIYIECKGKPRSLEEMKKYIWVRDSNPDIDLRFIIMDKKTLMPRSKKTTVYSWLVKNGFEVYLWPNLPNIKKL